MSDETLRLTFAGEVATLTLISKKGSLGPVFWGEMVSALGRLGSSRALVIRGEEVFSAGLDLKAAASGLGASLGNLAAFRAQVAPMHAAFEGVAGLGIPVIAAVHGWCIGAGLELAAACDIRLCSAEARFSLPEVKLGLTADLGGLQRLPGIVGQGWTRQLALSGDAITAATAERIGLVTEVWPSPAALFERAGQLAAQLATLPPEALQGTKKVLNAALPHAEGLSQAVAWNAEHLSSQHLGALLTPKAPSSTLTPKDIP